MSIIYSVLRLKNSCLQREEQIKKKYSLSPAEYNGLTAMNTEGKCTCSEFADVMKLSYSRGSRVIDKMVKSGLLKISDCTEDRRKCHIELTKKGKNIRMKIKRTLEECEDEMISNFNESELSVLKNSIEKLTLILEK